MPVYAYTCRECGTPLEVHQEFSDAALTECPTCGGRLRKQYGTIGVTFNGSGFYRTDSRADSGSGKPSGEGSSKSDSGSSGSKSDSGSGSSSSESGSGKKDSGSGGKKTDSGSAKPAASTAGSSSKPAS